MKDFIHTELHTPTMRVYIVKENIQMQDSNGWEFWKDSTTLSYHKTLEGATKKVSSLLGENTNSLIIWDGILQWDSSTNKGTCERMEEYPLYFIDTIELED